MNEVGRVITAMITPFNENGQVDYDEAAILAARRELTEREPGALQRSFEGLEEHREGSPALSTRQTRHQCSSVSMSLSQHTVKSKKTL